MNEVRCIWTCVNSIFKQTRINKCKRFTLSAPPLLLGGGGGWASDQIFKMGSLTGYQFLEGVAGKEGLTGGLQFLHKKLFYTYSHLFPSHLIKWGRHIWPFKLDRPLLGLRKNLEAWKRLRKTLCRKKSSRGDTQRHHKYVFFRYCHFYKTAGLKWNSHCT